MNDEISAIHQNIAIVVDQAQRSLGKLLDRSGAILYSGSATLRPGKYYFLGLNPGGSDAGTPTLREALANLSVRAENAYLDEDWGSEARKYGCGGHPLQRNFQYLFSKLDEDPRSVCASNLIFTRSIREDGAGGWQSAEWCWPVHEAVLAIVRPSVIITFGRQPFNFIVQKREGADPVDYPAGHGKWTWRYSVLKTGEKLLGLPHLSRYALKNRPDVLDRLRNTINARELPPDRRQY